MKGHLRGEPEGQHSTLWKGVTYAQGGYPCGGVTGQVGCGTVTC